MVRRKSLLIGINYTGSDCALEGCHDDIENMADFIKYRGYGDGPDEQLILRDDLEPQDQLYPTGKNILTAADWLVSEPDTCCFFHYSGHGGQVADPTGQHSSSLIDAIFPVDYPDSGVLDARLLHTHIVSKLHPTSTLFAIFDCCHSESSLELPFIYRSDGEGNVDQRHSARALSFFHSLRHHHEEEAAGLTKGDFAQDWSTEVKRVTAFAGCKDDETSADAQIDGVSRGAMSWAFLESLKNNPDPTYVEALHDTRALLKASEYTQIPQLCVGTEMDLHRPLIL